MAADAMDPWVTRQLNNTAGKQLIVENTINHSTLICD